MVSHVSDVQGEGLAHGEAGTMGCARNGKALGGRQRNWDVSLWAGGAVAKMCIQGTFLKEGEKSEKAA